MEKLMISMEDLHINWTFFFPEADVYCSTGGGRNAAERQLVLQIVEMKWVLLRRAKRVHLGLIDEGQRDLFRGLCRESHNYIHTLSVIRRHQCRPECPLTHIHTVWYMYTCDSPL